MKLVIVIGTLLFLGGCADTDFSFESAAENNNTTPTASQIAADHATADPSLNTVNTESTHSPARTPGGWIDSPAGDGNSP
jgi:hypothetical protein